MQNQFRARDILVGLFVVVGVLAVVVGIFWIRGVGVGRTAPYLVRYDNVGTLMVGSAVKYHGLLVGRVRALDIDPETPDLIRATLEIDASVPVTSETVAQVQKSDLLGDEYVELRTAGAAAGTAEALRVEGERLPPGSFLRAGEPFDLGAAMRDAQQTIVELGDVVALLKVEGQQVFSTVQAALEDTRDLLGPENRDRVTRTLENIDDTSASARGLVDESRVRLQSALREAEAAVANLKHLADEGEKMVAELRPEIRAAVVSLRETADGATATLAEVEQAVDGLDIRQLNQVLENVETTTRNLAELTRDLKERPYLLLRREKPVVKGLR